MLKSPNNGEAVYNILRVIGINNEPYFACSLKLNEETVSGTVLDNTVLVDDNDIIDIKFNIIDLQFFNEKSCSKIAASNIVNLKDFFALLLK